MPVELHGKNYRTPKKLSNFLLTRIFNEILSLENNLMNISLNVNIYKDLSSNLNVDLSSSPVRFPLLAQYADEADEIFNQLRNKGYSIGKWYRPLLFPGISDEVYNYINGSCKIAEECSSLIINLPTNVSEKTAKEIVYEIKNIRAKRKR
jgi:dTDP-4-amino-4,6-dideoxygalactose transaminase